MGNNFRFEKTTLDSNWDKFVAASENGTVFGLSSYLKNLNIRIGAYYLLNNQEIRAAFFVPESPDGEEAVLHDYVIYDGILFGPPTSNQNFSQRISENFEISSHIAEKLPLIYKRVSLSLHPSVMDIRPFLWVNYGTEKPKFIPDVRYTSYVEISDFFSAANLDSIKLYPRASYSRRQEIRYGMKKEVRTEECESVGQFVDFYSKTMLRQNVQVDPKVLGEMKDLVSGILREKLGRIFVSSTREGVPGSMAVFATDHRRSYYLFGANDPDLRDSHTGTAVLWETFKILNRDGVKEVDLEGVNSPKRGWFKLSFGGNLVPYYFLSYN